jgi:hypothetical protein
MLSYPVMHALRRSIRASGAIAVPFCIDHVRGDVRKGPQSVLGPAIPLGENDHLSVAPVAPFAHQDPTRQAGGADSGTVNPGRC